MTLCSEEFRNIWEKPSNMCMVKVFSIQRSSHMYIFELSSYFQASHRKI